MFRTCDGLPFLGRRPARAASIAATAARAAVEGLEPRRLLATTTLSSGTGDGSVQVRVDGYGMFGTLQSNSTTPGGAGDALYDPIGDVGRGGTTYASAVYFSGNDRWLTEFGGFGGSRALSPVDFLETSATEATSRFTLGDFFVELTQSIRGPEIDGTFLTQTYTVTNIGEEAADLTFVRQADFHLAFVAGSDDFGGVGQDGDFVFEFDTPGPIRDTRAFVGFENQGGQPVAHTVQVFPYFDNVRNADPPGIPDADRNQVANDGDNNDLTDTPADYTVSLQNDFLGLEPNDTITFTTTTRFATGAPVDVVGLPAVRFDQNTYTSSEGAPTVLLTLVRENDPGTAFSVDLDVIGGNARAGQDYVAFDGTVDFGPDDRFVQVPITLIDDDVLEPDETIRIQLSNPTNDVLLASPQEAVITLEDDTPFIGFSSANYSVSEDAGSIQITVQRTGSTEGAADVDFEVMEVTPAGPDTATAGEDFTPVSGTLQFGEGQGQATFTVSVAGGIGMELTERVQLRLSNVVGANLGTGAAATLNILNFEVAPRVTGLSFTSERRRITAIRVAVSEDLDPVSATDLRNYDLATRKERRFGVDPSRKLLQIRSVDYDAASDTITVVPTKPLKANQFHSLLISGTRPTALRTPGGTHLDGNSDATSGDDFLAYFAVGTKVSYFDTEGDRVQLKLRGPGEMRLVRDVLRDVQTLRLVGTNADDSILTGTLKANRQRGISDNRATLGDLFGAGTVDLRLPSNIEIIRRD